RVEASQEGEALCSVAAFLPQLALRRSHWILAGLSAASRQLPRDAHLQVTVLADQQHPGRIDERQDTDSDPHGENRVDDLLAVRQAPGIFAQSELSARIARRRRQARPGR